MRGGGGGVGVPGVGLSHCEREMEPGVVLSDCERGSDPVIRIAA